MKGDASAERLTGFADNNSRPYPDCEGVAEQILRDLGTQGYKANEAAAMPLADLAALCNAEPNGGKKPPGPKVTKTEQEQRKQVYDRYQDFKENYARYGFPKDTYANAAKWMLDKYQDMDFLTEDISDAADFDKVGQQINAMIRAYVETPNPKTAS